MICRTPTITPSPPNASMPRDTAVSLSPSPSLSRSTSLIRRIATFGLGISPRPRKGATVAAITWRSAARPEPIRGAENADIRCRIGAKSGAAFRRNHLPLSTEIRCRFAPIFCTAHAPCPCHLIETTACPFLPQPRHRSRPLRSRTFAAGLRPALNRASGVSRAI